MTEIKTWILTERYGDTWYACSRDFPGIAAHASTEEMAFRLVVDKIRDHCTRQMNHPPHTVDDIHIQAAFVYVDE